MKTQHKKQKTKSDPLDKENRIKNYFLNCILITDGF